MPDIVGMRPNVYIPFMRMVWKGINRWEKIIHNKLKLGHRLDKFSTVNLVCQNKDLILSIRNAATRGDGIACVE